MESYFYFNKRVIDNMAKERQDAGQETCLGTLSKLQLPVAIRNVLLMYCTTTPTRQENTEGSRMSEQMQSVIQSLSLGGECIRNQCFDPECGEVQNINLEKYQL